MSLREKSHRVEDERKFGEGQVVRRIVNLNCRWEPEGMLTE